MDYYILAGKHPVKVSDVRIWGAFFDDMQARTVAKTLIAEGAELIEVSTVFLGLDHRFGDDGPPVLFETMIFGGDKDQRTRRYCTWEEAETGHAEAVEAALQMIEAAHLIARALNEEREEKRDDGAAL